jgi:hypothetical protein
MTTDEHDLALDPLRRLFRFFARTQCQGRSPLYARLSEAIAEDRDLLELLLCAAANQRRPALLLASANHLLRERREHPLAAYYPIHGGTRPADDDAPAAFRDFCFQHVDELRKLLTHGSTQTNEIRRCFALRLGMARVAAHWPAGSVALLEVGASAGLNLHFDAYTYRIGDREARPADGSPVVLRTAVRGGGSVDAMLAQLPPVPYRLGVDLDPVDVSTDPAAGRWLEAFIWPEQLAELTTLRAAIDLARREPHPLVRADAVRDTARLITEVPEGMPVVVFTASLLSYLDAQARGQFLAQLATAARERPVAWLFTESPALVARTDVTAPALTGPLRDTGEVYAVGVSLRDGDEQHDEVLALADPYVEWIAPARHPGDDFGWAAAEGLHS